MATKAATAFNPRLMMEKAVEVMRRSVPERGADGSPSPKVGAVFVIGKLVKLGLLRREGAGPSTFYEVVRPS